jgi:DNA primase
VGFGGRVLGEGEPKYLNSAESEIFTKGRLLYGMSGARHAARKADRVLLVEGYFDAIRLVLAGIEETVAPLGTALTEQQAILLAKLTRNVFLLYDSDQAGLKATFRSGLELLRHGVSARVASLPEGEDPDTFVRTHGAAGLEAELANAVDIFERQLMEVRRRGWFDDLHKKRRAIDKLLPTLRAASDPLTRDLYVGRLAEVAGVDRDVLLRELSQPERHRGVARSDSVPNDAPGARRDRARPADGVVSWDERHRRDEPDRAQTRMRMGERRRGGRRVEDAWASSQAIPRVSPSAPVFAAERGLVQGMLQDPTQVDRVVERWGPEHFHSPVYRRIFERLLAADGAPLDAVTDPMDPADVAEIDRLLADRLPDPAAQVDAWLRRLEVRAIDEEKKRINARMLDSVHPPTDQEKDELLARKRELHEHRAALSGHWKQVGNRADGA